MPSLSRRTLVLGGAALAALAAVSVPAVVLPAPAPGFALLSAGEAELLAAIGEALFPAGNPLGVSAAEVDFPRRVDALLADELDPLIQPVFRYLLRALDAATLASRGAGFASLPVEARNEMLATWSVNDLYPRRLAYDAMKSVIGMAFFNAPEVVARVGWNPGCHGGTA